MRVTLIVLTAVLLAGCGQDSLPQTRDALQDRVGAVIAAANAGDGGAARTALAALRADVEGAQRLGSLSRERAADLARLADEVEAALPAPPPPPAAPKASRAPVTPAPAAPDPERGKGNDDRKGGGKAENDDEKDD